MIKNVKRASPFILGSIVILVTITSVINDHSSESEYQFSKVNQSDTVRLFYDQFGIIDNNGTKYGFNLNAHTGHFSFEDQGLENIVDKAYPETLRFPGGEISNYYHWQNGTVDSLIVEEEDRMKKLMNNFYLNYGGILDFSKFINYCQSRSIKPVLVVNLYTGTVEETKKWAEFIKKNNFEILGWELGNELYLPRYRGLIKNVEKYSTLAEEHARAIKSVNSDFLVAINSSPRDLKVEPGTGHRSNKWNEYLQAKEYYDCYSLHMYLRPANMYGEDRLINLDSSELQRLLREYTELVFERIPAYYELYEGKRMWMTEWNLHDVTKIYPNTFSHQLWYAFMTVWMIENENISANHYNVIFGPNNGFPLITRSLNSKRLIYEPNYHFAIRIGELLKKYPYVYRYNDEMSLVKVIGFGDKNRLNEVLIVNYSDGVVSLSAERKYINLTIRMDQINQADSNRVNPCSINLVKFDENSSN